MLSQKYPLIHPSILAADHGNLANEAASLAAAGADYLHIDVMDGHFVPNFGVGAEVIRALARHSNLPMDVHLMITDPARHLQFFRDLGAEIITIHPEADTHPARSLALIKEMGAVPGIALNPGTSIASIQELLPLCEHVLVMTVNPGFYGQSFLEFTLEKIKTLAELAPRYGYNLCVDGGVNRERVQQLYPLGVTNFVLGAALFKEDYAAYIAAIRQDNTKSPL